MLDLKNDKSNYKQKCPYCKSEKLSCFWFDYVRIRMEDSISVETKINRYVCLNCGMASEAIAPEESWKIFEQRKKDTGD